MSDRIIFLAEDDADDQEFLIEALQRLDASVKVHVESSGEKALEYLIQVPAEFAPRLILLDYNLPKLNGQQILRQISDHDRYRNINKLVWSTSSSPLYEQACLEAGAQAYLVKPTDILGISRIAQVVLDHCR